MANLSQDALFSLELVVDKLTIPKIPCKFPAIAFRLLDFPTLVIYHVEPELADKIKGQIQSDPHYKLGPQIPELLDKNGSFSLRKGKSCLLKISPDMLLSQLQSTPLYVMVIDTFPEVPKLVGNCTVPLDGTMDILYDDICKQGLAIPVVHGEKGVYKIYNLMGTQIGGLELGIRLLSLGVGLIPHLPAASILSGGKNVSVPSKKVNDEIQGKVADIVLGEFDQPSKGQIAFSKENETKLSAAPQFNQKIDPGQFQVETQTEEEIMQNMATQTEKRKARSRVRQTLQGLNIETGHDNMHDDIVVTNTICPPPLYFNSENDAKYSGGLEIFQNLMENQKENLETESVFSDSDTIRKEDWASDSDVDVESSPFEKPSIKTQLDNEYSRFQTKMKKSNTAPKIKGFPLLNALMTEIVALQNGQSDQGQQVQSDIQIFSQPKKKKVPTATLR